MIETLYKVSETNADLETCAIVFMNYSRDIAESKMIALYKAAGFKKDYMLLGKNFEMVCACFTADTIQRRGECQQ